MVVSNGGLKTLGGVAAGLFCIVQTAAAGRRVTQCVDHTAQGAPAARRLGRPRTRVSGPGQSGLDRGPLAERRAWTGPAERGCVAKTEGEFEEETYRKRSRGAVYLPTSTCLACLPCLWIKGLRVGYAQRERERYVRRNAPPRPAFR